MAEDIAKILWDFPAINPRTAIIAVDPGAYCIIPDETRATAAREIERLRVAFLSYLQTENGCGRTGKPCRSEETCGCALELRAYVLACNDEQSPQGKDNG